MFYCVVLVCCSMDLPPPPCGHPRQSGDIAMLCCSTVLLFGPIRRGGRTVALHLQCMYRIGLVLLGGSCYAIIELLQSYYRLGIGQSGCGWKGQSRKMKAYVARRATIQLCAIIYLPS